MGFSVMIWGAEKLVPAEYWCPYGTYIITCTNPTEFAVFKHNSHIWHPKKKNRLFG